MKILCKNKYWKLNEECNVDKILYLLIDRPNEINLYNSCFWYHNDDDKNEFHRSYDLPACISQYTVEWALSGILYRENNKSVRIWVDGKKEYLINGKLSYIKLKTIT